MSDLDFVKDELNKSGSAVKACVKVIELYNQRLLIEPEPSKRVIYKITIADDIAELISSYVEDERAKEALEWQANIIKFRNLQYNKNKIHEANQILNGRIQILEALTKEFHLD